MRSLGNINAAQYSSLYNNSLANTAKGTKSGASLTGYAKSTSKKTSNNPSASGKTDEEMRKLLRNLKNDNNAAATDVVFSGNTSSTLEYLLGTKESSEEENLLTSKKYNYKDVSSRIRSSKTSQSAGKAVLAAKRTIIELRREIQKGDGDVNELKIALTHAKKMEMVAKKKKHHLELEELVENTSKTDALNEKEEEKNTGIGNMSAMMSDSASQKLQDAYDNIIEAQEEIYDEMTDEYSDELANLSSEELDDVLGDLSDMVSEIGADELKELEEMMELVDLMEVVDPHMSEDDLKDLKRKHRTSEEKAMVKADADYFKSMMKYLTENKANSVDGMASSSSANALASTFGTGVSSGSIDISI